MFDSSAEGLGRLSGAQLADLVAENHRALMQHENQVLQLAAAWADLHDMDLTDRHSPLIERARVVGGDGTPAVSEFTAAEFGALQGTGMVAAWGLIAAALDLRHRLPQLWSRVQAGQVRAWQARKVAEATRELSWEACVEVDHQLAGYVGMVPWPRLQKILTAAVLEADPSAAAEREERARTEQTVYATDSEDGLRVVVARARSGDVAVFMATVNRIADILRLDGDTSPVGVRRSKAIGILAQPARALQLLLDHQHDVSADTEPAAPDEHRPEEGGDQQPGDALDPDRSIQTRSEELERSDPSFAADGDRDDAAAFPPHPAIPPPAAPSVDPLTIAERSHTSLDLTSPTRFDPVAARPRVVLHFHLSDTTLHTGIGMVRPEHGDPISLDELREFLVDLGSPVTVRPVLDPADVAPVDGYEVPQRTREAVRLRNIADVFPYGSCTSPNLDLDHTVPYLRHGRGSPPGQTRPDNLGPLARSSHRAATQGRWSKRQPDPGTYLWRSPHGWIFLVTNQGTLNLGHSSYAHAAWRAAAPPDTAFTAARADPQSAEPVPTLSCA